MMYDLLKVKIIKLLNVYLDPRKGVINSTLLQHVFVIDSTPKYCC